MSELDCKLQEARRRLEESRRVARLLERTRERYAQLQGQVEELNRQLAKEQRDVEQLQSTSITSLLASLLGNRDERLAREEQEVVAARLRYEGKLGELRGLTNETAELRERAQALAGAEAAYEKLLQQKEAALQSRGGTTARRLLELAEEQGKLEAANRELVEALNAANRARSELDTMLDQLNSARGWGTVDMLGGGLITTSIKHSRLDAARRQAQSVQLALNKLNRELADVNLPPESVVQLDSFTSFADYFFDGLFVDWIVQSRINDAVRATENHQARLVQTVRALETQLRENRARLATAADEHRKLIEEA